MAIRWHLQQGNVVIPKSASPERIRDNADVYDFELTDADVDAIAALDAGERTGAGPRRRLRGHAGIPYQRGWMSSRSFRS